MNKEEIFNVYKRYEKAIMENSKNVVANWSAMEDWMNNKLITDEEKKIRFDMSPAVTYIAVHAVNMGDIKLKSQSDGQWSTTNIQKGYDIIRDIRKAFDVDGNERLLFHFKRFLNLMDKLKECPACKLYLWKCLEEDDRGLLKDSYDKVKRMIEDFENEQSEKKRIKVLQEVCVSMSRE